MARYGSEAKYETLALSRAEAEAEAEPGPPLVMLPGQGGLDCQNLCELCFRILPLSPFPHLAPDHAGPTKLTGRRAIGGLPCGHGVPPQGLLSPLGLHRGAAETRPPPDS